MRASVLIGSYRRPDDLRRCLAALQALHRPADEVIVIHRHDDDLTAAVAAEAWSLPLRTVVVREAGVVAAVNCGLDAASGDLVALIDDDAVAPPDWLARIEAHYADPGIGAVGGRDIVHEHGGIATGERRRVGLIAWYGRMIGGHHLGVGTARPVHVLKGVNMSFRTVALGVTRADRRLLGAGAQVHFEVGLCTSLRRRGWRIVYDPDLVVDHYPSFRHDRDKRSGFSFQAQVDKAHNEQLMVLDALTPWRRPVFMAWSLLIGTSDVPGLLQLPVIAARRRPAPLQRFAASLRGRWLGMTTWRARDHSS